MAFPDSVLTGSSTVNIYHVCYRTLCKEIAL